MENLHQEVTLDIFSRLPAESVLQCRKVCKTWKNLLCLPHFADMHLHRQQSQLDDNQKHQNHCNDSTAATATATADILGLLIMHLDMEKSSPLSYTEYDEKKKSYKTVKRINHPPIKKRNCQRHRIAMVGSCNGLVCFSVPYPHGINDPIYICNPITSEYINLPKFDIRLELNGCNIDRRLSCNYGRVVSGFGYLPSTNEYKVVRIIYYEKFAGQYIGLIQVHTLGSGSGWRNRGETTYILLPHAHIDNPSGVRGILANGALYWFNYQELKIVAFDLEQEEFSVLSSPPCFFPNQCIYDFDFKLRVVGGILCVAQWTDRGQNIWLFNNKSSEWETMWRVPYEGILDLYWPITLTKKGEILVRFGKNTLVRYHTKTTASRFCEDLKPNLCRIEVIPHMNSFVSLKALGENSSRRR